MPPGPGRQDDAHVLDFDVLDLGHPAVSRTVVNLVEFEVEVHGLDEIRGSDLPIAAVFLSHGFAYKGKDHRGMAAGLLGEINGLAAAAAAAGRRRTRDVVVVTLDQRNHGDRRWYKDGGLKFMNDTKVFASHLAMSIAGGVQDQQLVARFLSARLFPSDDREIVEYISTGFSLAGHVTWRLLLEDPSFRVGITFSSLPPERIGARILQAVERGDFHLPKAVREFYRVLVRPGAFAGKAILAVHGAEDRILPFTTGEERWREIMRECNESGGYAEDFVQDTKGHVIAPEMVAKAAEFVWMWGLSEVE